MKIKDLVSYLEALAPPAWQEEYDNAGLITSHPNEITGVLVSLDCTEEVIEEAVRNSCNVVVAHHPIVFKGLKRFTGKTYVERTLIKAIKHDIAIYAIHTNLDHMHTGVNARIGNLLGLENLKILSPKRGILAKLYTYVPAAHAEKVRAALFAAGAGTIGNYDECSYEVEGRGTFRGNEHTNPFAGEKNKRHTEPELKIEVIFPLYLQQAMVAALKNSHPYEEVAYEVVKLENAHPLVGSGMVGSLPVAVELEVFLAKVKEVFGCGVIKYTPGTGKTVSKIAVCGGAGMFLTQAAIGAGADVYITSDIKYHEFFDADGKIVLADIGHYESEQFTSDLLVDELKKKFTTFAVLKANTYTNPVKYL